jgi:tartrate-resistant acid phosphatase type 5
MEVNLFVLGDAGFEHNKIQKQVADAMSLYRNGQLTGTNGARVPLDAVVLTGDNFEDQPFEDAVKAQFEEAYAEFNLPFFVTLGNHDLPGKKAKAEWEYAMKDAAEGGSPRLTVNSEFPFTHYRVELPDANAPLVTLIELDSNGSARQKEGEVFLKQHLDLLAADPRKRWVVVFTHYPLYTNGCHQEGDEFPNRWRQLLQDRVHFYLCGHNHNLEHLEVEDPPGTVRTTSFILSGAGGQIYKIRSHERKPFARSLAGFVHLRFLPDKAVVRIVGFAKGQGAADARIVHSFERDFTTGVVTVNTPTDATTGLVPPALLAEDIGAPAFLTAQCGEPPLTHG